MLHPDSTPTLEPVPDTSQESYLFLDLRSGISELAHPSAHCPNLIGDVLAHGESQAPCRVQLVGTRISGFGLLAA